MRVKNYFLNLCAALAFWLGVFLVVSCGTEKADFIETAILSSETESSTLESAAFASAKNDSSRAILMNKGEEPDFILRAYLDPALREGVQAFFWDLTGSAEVAAVVLSNAVGFDIPPALAFALCWEESRYKHTAVNHNRNNTIDRGLFQLNSASFPAIGTDDFFEPALNARLGLAHLRWCLNTAGTEVAGLAMYNAGTARVSSSGTPKNTLDYISRILKYQRRIEELFMAEYPRIAREGNGGKKKFSIRLSLLTPLGS